MTEYEIFKMVNPPNAPGSVYTLNDNIFNYKFIAVSVGGTGIYPTSIGYVPRVFARMSILSLMQDTYPDMSSTSYHIGSSFDIREDSKIVIYAFTSGVSVINPYIMVKGFK